MTAAPSRSGGKPPAPADLHEGAMDALRRGDAALAAARYRRILDVEPRNADAWYNLGLALEAARDATAAVDAFRRAASTAPDDPSPWIRQAGLLHRCNRPREARDALNAAAERARTRPDLQMRIAGMGRDMGFWPDAAAVLEAVAADNPLNAEAWCNLGLIYKRMGKSPQAEAAYRRALDVRPDFPEAHSNLSVVLTDDGHTGAAMDHCRAALTARPQFAGALNNLARAMKYSGRAGESLAWFEKARQAAPDDRTIGDNFLYCLSYVHDGDPALAADHHRQWGRRIEAEIPVVDDIGREPDPDRPLTVGYVSPDFRRHPVTQFLMPVLRHHRRGRFRIAAFSSVAVPDAVTRQVRGRVDAWHDIAGLSDAAAARRVAQAGVDILVDLAGHTAGNRLGVFARRPAPVQVTYLGYPQTTGLTRMDARITDAWADPDGDDRDRRYTETLVRLPGCFLCFDAPAASPEPSAASGGGPITFGSFNNLAKVNGAVIDAWTAILRQVPDSRLMIKFKSLADAAVRDDVYRRLADRGIPARRVELVGHLPDPADHLRRYLDVDVALDTFPYNGTTTTCEALWMGVPVVALAGSAHAGRVGVSILTSLGLSALAADDVNGYVATAAQLAADREALNALRRGLRRRMQTSPLMDGAALTRHLEAAYRRLWGQWCARTASP